MLQMLQICTILPNLQIYLFRYANFVVVAVVAVAVVEARCVTIEVSSTGNNANAFAEQISPVADVNPQSNSKNNPSIMYLIKTQICGRKKKLKKMRTHGATFSPWNIQIYVSGTAQER